MVPCVQSEDLLLLIFRLCLQDKKNTTATPSEDSGPADSEKPKTPAEEEQSPVPPSENGDAGNSSTPKEELR